ncbi:MAG: RNA polymerase sigma factor [Gaiellaceae bacterium]
MTSVAVRVRPARAIPPDTGESAETGRLFEEYSGQLLAYCVRQLGSRSAAEDAVQTTFMYALRALRRGVVPECEAAWLTTIARNVCHCQRRTRNRRGPLASGIDLDTIGLAQPDGDVDGLLVGLKDALASIPENQCRALVLREWHGMPPREIATELGLTPAATHALLTRARHSLARALTLPQRPVLGVVWLLLELRSHVKALLAGVSTKAAVAVVGVGVGVGGIAVERSLGSDLPPRPPVQTEETGAVEAWSTSGVWIIPVASKPQVGRGGMRVTRGATAPKPSTAAHPLMPARVPEPTSPRGSDSTSDPELASDFPQTQPEPPAVLPLEPLPLPEVRPRIDLQSPVDLPPLPAVEPLPAVDLPPLPAVKPPPVVDLPSLSGVDAPPLPPVVPSLP